MIEPDETQVVTYFDSLSNWNRWGADDERGALNFITEDKVKQSASLVQCGRAISCQRPMSVRHSADNPSPVAHFMITSGEGAQPDTWGAATDWFGVAVHGETFTHLDAIGHMFWDQKIYNGWPAAQIGQAAGARVGGIDLAADGLVSRGVLLDIPRFRGVDRLSPGEAIGPDELSACAAAEGVSVGSGDILIVRTGRDVAMTADEESGYAAPQLAGLHAACLPWLHSQEVSVLVGDGGNDVVPSGYDRVMAPIHIVGMVAIGLWLLDDAYLEDLAVECAREQRWEFQFLVASLRLRRATGSPVNPIAIL